MKLTEQQAAIVRHEYGPARVFAVAGAGKTTAMVARIRRLVERRLFTPERILATSFNRMIVDDLQKSLQTGPANGVKPKTLHALGYSILHNASRRGWLSGFKLGQNELDPEGRELFVQTLREARQRSLPFVDRLDGLDQQDFLDYVGACKADLAYPDLQQVALPASVRRQVRQAESPAELEWYLDLYRLFEEVRRREGRITFDDMLLTAWETLVKSPEALHYFQGHYDCLLVDEFQDINRAQFELLALLAAPHGNFMVIGDDDQTIYEWRGARADFLLKEFPRRYPQARDYKMEDNFRCRASQVVLANRVIALNKQRQPKQLGLTQGFGGKTLVEFAPDAREIARRIAERADKLIGQGILPGEIAVLVRLNAQTPYLEQAFSQAALPYRIVNSLPFYERPEIVTLLDYFRLAEIEKTLAAGQELDLEQTGQFETAWANFLNPLLRFIPREVKNRLRQEVLSGQSLRQSLSRQQAGVKEGVARIIERLGQVLQWLVEQPASLSAAEVLTYLEKQLNFCDYLRKNSGLPETGEGRAASVSAFLDYAQGKGNRVELLAHLAELASQRQATARQPASELITISTIHGAKGLEWPVVFVPQCNDGILPFDQEKLEEERRLLYVAITRARRDLYLYVGQDRAISPFLLTAKHNETLAKVRTIAALLERDPESWQAPEMLCLLRDLQPLNLEGYFSRWWDLPVTQQTAIAARVRQLHAALQTQPVLMKKLSVAQDCPAVWQQLHPAEITPNGDFPGLADLVAQPTSPKTPAAPSRFYRFRVNEKVQHRSFGTGKVIEVREEVNEQIVTVLFEQVGEKRLAASSNMLTPG